MDDAVKTLAEQYSLMVERNLQGIELEREGLDVAAMTLYETNVHECFDGSHPYERLRIFYTKRHDYPNAIRVCQAFLNLPRHPLGYDEKKRQRFQEHLSKLRSKTVSIR